MCIYLGDEESLTYHNREHIFPAGLGGVQMLPSGYVSDQANALFSPLELQLMHNSTISINRAMEGPGKRGILNPKHATESEIYKYTTEDGMIELAYIKSGISNSIPQLHIYLQNGDLQFITPKTEIDYVESFNSFSQAMKNFSNRFVSIKINELKDTKIIIGYWKKKYYIAFSDMIHIGNYLPKINRIFQNSAIKNVKSHNTHGTFEIPIKEDSATYRVYAKIAFNSLAYLKGLDYVMDSRFNKIRDAIIGKTNITNLVSPPISSPKIFPPSAHVCIFNNVNNKLIGYVCLYQAFSFAFEMSTWDTARDHSSMPLGYICDWQNKKEYSIEYWIKHIANNQI